jgi:hypothetical protein
VDFLKKIAANAAVRKAALALVLAVLAAAGFSLSGCSLVGLGKPVSPQLAVYECQLAALTEAVPVPVAEDLVMAARAGNVEYVVSQLLRLGLNVEAIQAAAEAFNACGGANAAPDAPVPAPAGLIRT